jgi:hypothetical protein
MAGLFFIHCGKSCLEELSLLLTDQLGRRKSINSNPDGALAHWCTGTADLHKSTKVMAIRWQRLAKMTKATSQNLLDSKL